MLNAPALFSVTPVAAPQGAAVRPSAPAFSYDAAVAALERQSAQSLDIHGGKPRTAVTGGRPGSAAAAESTRGEAAPTANDRAERRTVAAAQGDRAQDFSQAAKSAAPAITVAAPVAASTPLAGAANPPAPSLPSARGATASREGLARLKSEPPSAPALPRAPASSVKQFAEILAQRLENASQFDLRLDPPALGSVEGRLILTDDGRARLALAFDNQSAFDLFRRDDAALRFALADAGFDLSGRNLQFSFRDPSRDGQRHAAEPSLSSQSHAPLHRGAIDIRA